MAQDVKFKPEDLAVISEAVGQSRRFTIEHLKQNITGIQWLMAGVVIVCVLGFLQLIIDSFHINSATYREYAEKADAADTLETSNQTLLTELESDQKLLQAEQAQMIILLKQK